MRIVKGTLTIVSILAGIYLNAQVTSNLSANPAQGCAPLVVNFTDLSTGSPNYWEWHFGNSNGPVYRS